MTLSDLQGHPPTSNIFNIEFSYTAVQQLTRFQLTHERRAVPLRQRSLLLRYASGRRDIHRDISAYRDASLEGKAKIRLKRQTNHLTMYA